MYKIFNRRGLAFWLLIAAFTFTSVKAQKVINNDLTTKTNEQIKLNQQPIDFSSPREEISFKVDPLFSKNKSKTGKRKQDDVNVRSREWGFYGGSFTVHKDLRGESQKAPVVLFGIRHAWSIKNNQKRRFRYYMDLNPLIIVNYRERREVQATPTTTTFVGERKTVFGVGFVPLGLQYNWRNDKKYQPFIAGGIGVAVFNKKFPDNRSPLNPDKIGNRFQIMPEFGAGLEIRQSESRSYFIGYKYHHMSNAYTAPLNVGYNTNMVYFGTYFQRDK